MVELNPILAIVDAPFDVEETNQPFGRRWGGEAITLTGEYLAALQEGKSVAVDVMGKYVVFFCLQDTSEKSDGRKTCQN